MDHLSHTSFSKIFIDIFLVMDVLGIIPIVLLLLKGIPLQRQRQIVMREMGIALFVMLAAQFLGKYVLEFLRISQSALYFSGFVVLLITALSIIFPSPPQDGEPPSEEPFIVPIAIPLIAGSGVLARIMIFSDQYSGFSILTLAIVSAWLVSTFILFFLPQISRILGTSGVATCERLMGLLVLILSIDSGLSGVHAFIHHR